MTEKLVPPTKCLLIVLLFATALTNAQNPGNPASNHGNAFEELNYLLPTPNSYRTASGAPGPNYWQQRADYDMAIDLDEANNVLTGSETITYFNNSPNPLSYLWLQLDGNIYDPNSDNNRNGTNKMQETMTNTQLIGLEPWRKLEGYGVNITKATDADGKALKYSINQTMMRLELPTVLAPGQKYIFLINWNYKINDKLTRGGRGGYEYFADDDNNLYSITQFYPRMAVYSDFQGWQTLPFTGGAEFALNFGNFKMSITVPADHIIASTGECQNYKSVLTAAQYNRWQQAQTAGQPIEVVTLDEALQASKTKSTAKKTWVYIAKNVRDVAFNSSRRLVWDAMATPVQGNKVMAMSYYCKEAYPLYRKYSTRVIAHTLKTYSQFTIAYPYPVAISVEAANGMEYPMLSMNYGRAEKDGSYSEATKYGMISVIIHEVGHNYFPMIVNSDERQYWWMDEGLNSFMQYLSEQEFDPYYPSRRGPAKNMVDYMKLPKNQLEPIMTKGEYVQSVGNNAYGKASTGLNILRETIMGREAFDFAFKQYATRWAFHHPTPADLFRTMEDASGMDLDWFWRAWFFGTDPVDISIDNVQYYRMDNGSGPEARTAQPADAKAAISNKAQSIQYATDIDTTLRDFYYYNRQADAVMRQSKAYQQAQEKTDGENKTAWAGKHFYELTFSTNGGMVMPIIIEWTYKDGTKEMEKVPVTVWRLNEKQVTKVFVKDKEVASIVLDPNLETADVNVENGMWPLKEMPGKFQLFKEGQAASRGQASGGNAMQNATKK